jgi:protein required for attachment to host cells
VNAAKEQHMTTTWVVVAHQTGARILEHRSGFGRNLTLLREIANPDGRKKNAELNADRPGTSATRGQAGGRAMHQEHSAHDHVVEKFVHEIAAALHHDRAASLFDALILVAEPGVLGSLRAALDPATARKVVSSVTKDLASFAPRDIAGHIADVLPL